MTSASQTHIGYIRDENQDRVGTGQFGEKMLLAVCVGMFFIASSFFTYTGLLGRDFLVLDILIFIFSVLLTFFLSRYFEVRCPGLRLPLMAVYVLLLLIVICFFSFTFAPPELPLFTPPT